MAQVIASVVAEIGAKIDNFQKGAANVKSGLQGLSNEIAVGMAKFSAYSAALEFVGNTLVNTVKDTLAYDDAVRQLAYVSGQGAEESSRLIQVLDDFKLSSNDVLTATKALTKQGLSPTLETLAALSDQYNTLNPGQERAEFLMKNFGKTGLQFAEAMSKGGDALREMGNEVEKSLIRTDAQIAKTRLAELAFDRWADKVEALKVTVGSGLIGVLDGSTKEIQDNAQAIFRATNGYNFNTNAINKYTDAQRAAWEEAQRMATEQYLLANGMDISTDKTNDLTMSLEEQEAAMRAVSSANQDFLSIMGDIQASEEDFADRNKSLIEKRIELEGKRAQEIAKGWAMDAEKVKEYDQALAENDEAIRENAREHELANRKIVLGLLERKLMQDGILDDKELLWLLEKGKAWGIYSDTIIAETRAAIDEANRLIAGLVTEKTFTLNVQTSGGNTTNTKHVRTGSGRASGGNVTMGQAYVVGERGAEMFIPATNGRIVPNGAMQGGGSAEIVAAIQNSRLNEEKLARLLENALLRVAK